MQPKSFDIGSTPLYEGLSLLEAGAGSGKTFSIEGLLLRLLLERGLSLRDILVCTYTNAATRELRSRIRERLRRARALLDEGAPEKDPALVAALRVCEANTARQRLALALESFDQAQVFTIHGFCNRVLSEHAFESGISFERELMADSKSFAGTLALDYRRRLARNSPLLLLFAEEYGGGLRDRCRNLYLSRGADRSLPFRPETAGDWPGPEEAEAQFRQILNEAVAIWVEEGDEILSFIRDKSRVNKPLYEKADLVEAAMLLLCESKQGSDVASALAALSIENVLAHLKKRPVAQAPDCAMFHLARRFTQLLRSCHLGLMADFLKEADLVADRRREELGSMGYDDLLYQTAEALARGQGLAAQLRARYRVALVDEFQDTDRLQWYIFNTLFNSGFGHSLFIIGDPKQAIYRFRGADIHTYLDAADQARQTLALDRNWRSDPLLVEAVNALFSARVSVFGSAGMEFRPALAAASPSPERAFLPAELAPEPMRFILQEVGAAGSADAWNLACMSMDMLALLRSGATVGGRPLRGSDIAVIVPRHNQALDVLNALRVVGIQAVQETGASVFESEEAATLLAFLTCMLQPSDEALRRWVLAGPLFGMDAAQLAELAASDALWRRWDDAFVSFCRSWEAEGIVPAFRALERATGLRARIMGSSGGERALTNILHLVELLNEAAHVQRLAPQTLVQWLSRMMQEDEARPMDGHAVRLESDERAVTVLTRHKSKGLEYPFVFVPFCDMPAKLRKDSYLTLRDEKGCPALWLEPAPAMPPEARLDAEREDLEERMRLLYVTLTRARNRCYLYLRRDELEKSSARHSLLELFGADDWEGFRAYLHKCSDSVPDSISIEYRDLPPAPKPLGQGAESIELCLRSLMHRPDCRPMITSFSALQAGAEAYENKLPVAELPEREDAPALLPESAPAELSGVAAFPKGAGAGSFFHACLEKMDFADSSGWAALVRWQLALAGMDASMWAGTALDCLNSVLDTPLEKGGFALRGTPAADLLREMEFYIPAQGPDFSALSAAFAEEGVPFADSAARLARMEGVGVDGYLKGFVDLIFRREGRYYILDWKSNWLGADASAYSPAAMHGAMLEHNYYLQGCLYALAFRRGMRQRQPNWDYVRDFGGIYYLFLRGAQPLRPGSGVVRFCPSATMLDAVEAALGGEGRTL